MHHQVGLSRASKGGLHVRFLVVASLALVFLLGAAVTAEAGVLTVWSGVQPSGNVGANVPVTIQGTGAFDAYPLVASTARLYVDGFLIPRASYNASISRTSAYFYYVPSPKLPDGTRTFRVEVSDSAGRLSSRTWSANVVQPPTALWVAPTGGSTVKTGRPAVVMSLSDNTPATTFTVAGEAHSGSATGPVVATFSGTALPAGQSSFALSSELPPGGYYLTASVTDAAGNTASRSGASALGFTAVAPAAMTVLEGGCGGCHPSYVSAHPTRSTVACTLCHPGYDGDHMQGTEDCRDCHYSGWHNGGARTAVAVTSPCASCHTPDRPEVIQHTPAAAGASHAGSCGGCHTGSLLTLHALTPVGSVYPNQCDTCHASANSRVQAAIAAANTLCSGCHDAPHGPADHSGTRASCALSGCHSAGAIASHLTCETCHTLATLPAGTECMNCHPSATTPHALFASRHVGDSTGGTINGVVVTGCRFDSRYEGFCHDMSNTMRLHANVHNKSDGCPECHAPGKSLTNKCVSCHTADERNLAHHNNNKFLADPRDATPGSYYWYVANSAPAGGWNSLDSYDCQWCHWTFYFDVKPTLPEYRSPYAGARMWYGGMRSAGGGYPADTTLTLPGTFTATADTRLEYMVNYQTKLTYDYGYSEVSTDGVTWTTVPGNLTSAEAPTTRHLGNGIHGDSAGWVAATFDLSAYAGQQISVRLRYKTSWTPQAFGYAVDDIVLRDGTNVLFADGAETATSVAAAGWERVGTAPVKYDPDDPSNCP